MKDEVFLILRKYLPGVLKNVSLKKYTTFKIGGPAEYFFFASNVDDVVKSVSLAKKMKMPLFIFGGGSNLLVADEGIRGLVVKMESHDRSFTVDSDNKILAYSGVNLGNLVAFSVNRGLQGLEWAGGLPGTFGGAVRGNAGAFGGEIKDSIVEVQALDGSFKLRQFNKKQAKFSYRNSIFKQKNWVIVAAKVRLKNGDVKELKKVYHSRIQYRQEKHPLEYPNAGSVFKNISVQKVPKKFKSIFHDKIKQDPFPIVPAAWFIIGVGLAGKKVGKAQISKKHSNYIVNLGGASSKDVIALMNLAKKRVKAKYHIDLEAEIQYVG